MAEIFNICGIEVRQPNYTSSIGSPRTQSICNECHTSQVDVISTFRIEIGQLEALIAWPVEITSGLMQGVRRLERPGLQRQPIGEHIEKHTKH
jgi:hypothetical protein